MVHERKWEGCFHMHAASSCLLAHMQTFLSSSLRLCRWVSSFFAIYFSSFPAVNLFSARKYLVASVTGLKTMAGSDNMALPNHASEELNYPVLVHHDCRSPSISSDESATFCEVYIEPPPPLPPRASSQPPELPPRPPQPKPEPVDEAPTVPADEGCCFSFFGRCIAAITWCISRARDNRQEREFEWKPSALGSSPGE
jgi:hypothetical protein